MWSYYYGTIGDHYVSLAWFAYMCMGLLRNYYATFSNKWWKKYTICVWSFHFWAFSLLTTSLVCPSVPGATVHKPRRRAATLPLLLGRKFQGSIFFSAFGVAAVGKDLMVENKFWVHHWSKMFYPFYVWCCLDGGVSHPSFVLRFIGGVDIGDGFDGSGD